MGTPSLDAWKHHPEASDLHRIAPLPEAGGNAFFALRTSYSSFDNEIAPRPYVFQMNGETLKEVWRGTALAYPLVDARITSDAEGSVLCATHRGDSFLALDPESSDHHLVAYRWNGFGFTEYRGFDCER